MAKTTQGSSRFPIYISTKQLTMYAEENETVHFRMHLEDDLGMHIRDAY
jgi:hypothetical protein